MQLRMLWKIVYTLSRLVLACVYFFNFTYVCYGSDSPIIPASPSYVNGAPGTSPEEAQKKVQQSTDNINHMNNIANFQASSINEVDSVPDDENILMTSASQILPVDREEIIIDALHKTDVSNLHNGVSMINVTESSEYLAYIDPMGDEVVISRIVCGQNENGDYQQWYTRDGYRARKVYTSGNYEGIELVYYPGGWHTLKSRKSGEGKYLAYKYTYLEARDYTFREDYDENGDNVGRCIYKTDNNRLTKATMKQKIEDGKVVETVIMRYDEKDVLKVTEYIKSLDAEANTVVAVEISADGSIETTYNSSGIKIKEEVLTGDTAGRITYFWPDGTRSKVDFKPDHEKYDYIEFDETGRKTKLAYLDGRINTYPDINHMICETFKDSVLVKRSTYDKVEEAWRLLTYDNYETNRYYVYNYSADNTLLTRELYDKDGTYLLEQEYSHILQDDKWVRTLLHVTRDNEGNITGGAVEISADGSIKTSYNKYGIKLKEEMLTGPTVT